MAYQAVQQWELDRYHGPRRGTAALRDVLILLFAKGGAFDDGIYNRRPVRGGTSWSLHAVGRAIDIGVRNHDIGEFIATGLVKGDNPVGCGICEVIWNRRRWTAEKGWQPYSGVDPHTSHVHIGQTIEMADNPATTDQLHGWFAGVLTNAA